MFNDVNRLPVGVFGQERQGQQIQNKNKYPTNQIITFPFHISCQHYYKYLS